MTEDTENLRKFLESDDPAMVRMGLSMAKGSGVPDELLPTIIGLYMWDDDKTIRAAAKSVFTMYAPADIQAKVKENWKASYRTLSITGDKFSEAIRLLLGAFKSQDDFAEIVWRRAERLTEALMDRNRMVRLNATEALGKIGNERAVEPLIKTLEDDFDSVVRMFSAEALGKIGDERAVGPLIKMLESAGEYRSYAAEALGMIGGERVVEPLFKALSDNPQWVRKSAAEALDKLGWAPENDGQRAAYLIAVDDWKSLVEWGVPAVEPLIKALGRIWKLGSYEDEDVSRSAAKALGEIGKPAVEPLIKLLRDEDDYVNYYAAKALGKIGDARAVEPLIKALSDDDWKVRRSAAEALGKIGDLRAIEPLITALDDRENTGTISAGMPSDEAWRVADAAKEALIQVAEVRVKGDEKKNALKFLESDDLLAILSQLSNEQKEKIKQLEEFEYLFRMYF